MRFLTSAAPRKSFGPRRHGPGRPRAGRQRGLRTQRQTSSSFDRTGWQVGAVRMAGSSGVQVWFYVRRVRGSAGRQSIRIECGEMPLPSSSTIRWLGDEIRWPSDLPHPPGRISRQLMEPQGVCIATLEADGIHMYVLFLE